MPNPPLQVTAKSGPRLSGTSFGWLPYPYTAKAVHVLVHGSEGARACSWTTNDSTFTR